ncbi:MAG: DUF87 domain-containing protein [Pyrinomonadaceae bacterium]
MKNRIRLGATADDEEVQLDIEALLDTRMVIQANSGGGKSYFIRLLAERAAQTVPFIILDYEGEYSTLREKVDLVLVGAEGEIAAETRSAKLLARRLIETEVSAVVDLYDLRVEERQEYARIFLESIVNLPRELWRPYLIIIDEAHKLCPEKGDAKATSTQAVIDVMSMGGKRGFCGILATQRFSKLHNNSLGEVNNYFIGRTSLDADQKRAAGYLGITSAEERIALRELDQGYFHTFGPALSSKGVVLFKTDRAETTHLRGAARRRIQPPKPSREIQKILKQFEDLPQKAQEEARSLEEAKARIQDLQREIKRLERAQPVSVEKVKVKEAPVIKASDIKRVETVIKNYSSLAERLTTMQETLSVMYDRMDISKGEIATESQRLADMHSKATNHHAPTAVELTSTEPRAAKETLLAPPPPPRRAAGPPSDDGVVIKTGAQRMLVALYRYERVRDGLTRDELSTLAHVAKGGTLSEYVRSLLTAGFVTESGGRVYLTDEGRARVPDSVPHLPFTTSEIAALYMSDFKAGAQRMFRLLIDKYPDGYTRNDLSDKADVAKGGTLSEYVRSLLRPGVIVERGGQAYASEILFLGERN